MTTLELGLLTANLGQSDTGVNQAVRGIVLTPRGEVEAFVKRLADPRETMLECLCALLGRSFGLPIPPPLLVWMPEELGVAGLAFGSASIDAPNLLSVVETSAPAVMLRLSRWPKLGAAASFDEWIANCDRHPGNLLHDGMGDFWLIDHGLSLHPQIPSDGLAPRNQLFEVAVAGQAELALLELKAKVQLAMNEFAGGDLDSLNTWLSIAVWSDGLKDAAIQWLRLRQPHLLRLGSLRIPVRQGDMLGGNP